MSPDMHDRHTIDGHFGVDAQGDIWLRSYSDTLTLEVTGGTLGSTGASGDMVFQAASTISAQTGAAQMVLSNNDPAGGSIWLTTGSAGVIGFMCGPTATPSAVSLSPEQVLLYCGALEVGAKLELTPTSVKLSLGPPDVGPCLSMTLESIKLSIAENSWELSLVELKESILAVTNRVASATGHTLTAAETELGVAATGITSEAPLNTHSADAASSLDEALQDHSTSGVRTDTPSMWMIG